MGVTEGNLPLILLVMGVERYILTSRNYGVEILRRVGEGDQNTGVHPWGIVACCFLYSADPPHHHQPSNPPTLLVRRKYK